MLALIVVLAVLWGALAGALLPRAAYRLSVEPAEPWRDTCPAGHPVRGWAGPARCRPCAAAGSGDARYGGSWAVPAVATALACGALAAAAGAEPELVVWLLLAPVAVLLVLVDRAVQRLPDVLTLPLAGGAAALLGGAAALGGAGSWTRALLGGLALGGAFFVLFFINPRGMGFGDVKLALALGVGLGWYGWDVLFLGAFAGFVIGALYSAGLLLARRASRKTALPFGPFMVVGALLGLVVGGLAAG